MISKGDRTFKVASIYRNLVNSHIVDKLIEWYAIYPARQNHSVDLQELDNFEAKCQLSSQYRQQPRKYTRYRFSFLPNFFREMARC